MTGPPRVGATVGSMVDALGDAASPGVGASDVSRPATVRVPTAICGADDEIRLVLRGVLLLHRCPVTKEARSPEELGRLPAESKVVVYDAHGSPESWRGPLLALVREHPNLWVLALLPVADEAARSEAERAGAHATLVKPFLTRDFIEAIASLAAGSGSI